MSLIERSHRRNALHTPRGRIEVGTYFPLAQSPWGPYEVLNLMRPKLHAVALSCADLTQVSRGMNDCVCRG